MRQARPYLFSAALGILLSYSLTASASAERGRLLYENHCMGCHISTVHIRDQRKSKTPAEMRASILRWSCDVGCNARGAEPHGDRGLSPQERESPGSGGALLPVTSRG